MVALVYYTPKFFNLKIIILKELLLLDILTGKVYQENPFTLLKILENI